MVDVLLVVEHARLALEREALLACDLGHAAAGREVALEDADVARRLDGLVERADDVLAVLEAGERVEVLGERLARDGHDVAVDELVLEEVLEDGRDAANLVHVLHDVLARRLEVGDERYPVAHGLEVVDAELDAARVRDGDQVQDGVGRAAEDHGEDHGVLERGARHDVARPDVVLEEAAHGRADGVALVLLLLVRGRRRRRVGERHAHGLGGRRHRVGSVHAAARAALLAARVAHRVEADLLGLGRRTHLEELAVRLERAHDVEHRLVLTGAGLHGAAVHCAREGRSRVSARSGGRVVSRDAPMIPGRLRRPRAMSTPGLQEKNRVSIASLADARLLDDGHRRTCSCRTPAGARGDSQHRALTEEDSEQGRTGIVTMPSSQCPPAAVSTWSAIRSRLWSEKLMPNVPIEMPSETPTVPNP